MPFQSEKQRKYLWANEPEIARDWTDTYGSRIQNNTGGINRLGFANGPNWQVDEPVVAPITEDDEENPLEKFMRYIQGNAGNLSQANVDANKNFIGNMKFSPNNPYRMTSGPFQGMNAPGSSAMGSKNPKEMAQKWVDKFGGVDHQTTPMKEKKAKMRTTAGLSPVENVHHSYNRGGITRTAFGTGLTKEYQDFENWYKARNKFQREQTIEELKEDYYRDKELQKTQNQKSMVATGGIMRLGYAQGNPHTDTSSTSYGPPGSASRKSAPTHQPTSNLGGQGQGQGDGAVSGYIQEELKKVPESVSSKFLGNKIGGAVGIGGMLPQYMLGNMLFNKIRGNQSSLDDYQKNYYKNTHPDDSEEEIDGRLAKGTTWSEFLQDTSPAAAFDPAIHNSWGDVYQSWLNQNTFS